MGFAGIHGMSSLACRCLVNSWEYTNTAAKIDSDAAAVVRSLYLTHYNRGKYRHSQCPVDKDPTLNLARLACAGACIPREDGRTSADHIERCSPCVAHTAGQFVVDSGHGVHVTALYPADTGSGNIGAAIVGDQRHAIRSSPTLFSSTAPCCEMATLSDGCRLLLQLRKPTCAAVCSAPAGQR